MTGKLTLVLFPVVGTKSGKRYYVSERNLKEFIHKFEKNYLN